MKEKRYLCPRCGERAAEEHGTEPGDCHWFLCLNCSFVFEDGETWDAEHERKVRITNN